LPNSHGNTGQQSRLSLAGWLFILLSLVATVAVDLVAGSRPVIRLASRTLGAFYPLGVIACSFGGAIVVWSSGVGLSRLVGIPLLVPVPLATRSNGNVGLPREQTRGPFQFTLGRLQWVILIVAVVCALARLDIVQVAMWVYLGSMLMVITVGTGVAVARRRPSRLHDYLIQGGLAGSCLGAVCLGWMFVVLWVVEQSTRSLWLFGFVTILGGILGVLVGLAMVAWRRWRLVRR
jgi:hypothetical protein